MGNKEISRRNFLKDAALFGGAAALAGVGLSGCSPSETDQMQTAVGTGLPESWDHEADIIVVGAGAAGLATGIEASDLGMSVIILESQSQIGGSSAICNGGIAMPGTPLQKSQGIEDSVDIFFDDLMENTQVDNDPEMLRTHCEGAAELWDWLTGMGLEFKEESLIATQGQSRAREHHVAPTGVVSTLEQNALEKGAEILVSTKAVDLLQDPSTKQVVGVVAGEGNEVQNFKANKGVVLAAGGYARNIEMLNQEVYGTGAENAIAFTGLGDNGEGIIMARRLGAATRHMGYISMNTGQNPDGSAGASASMMNVGAVCVNLEGKRFVNEAQGYAGMWTEVMAQPEGICYQVWDDALAQEYASNDSSLYAMDKIEATGLLLKADTLEELASLMGIPADALVATMEKYNNDVSTNGADSEFGREHIISTSGTPFALDTAPFYGFKTGNVIYGTTGALAQNTDGQVMHIDGNPIPGLWAAGAPYHNMGIIPLSRRAVGASGCGFGGAMIWGRLAARKISEV